MAENNLYLIGYASGMAGADPRCGEGPLCLQSSAYMQNNQYLWQAMLKPPAEVENKTALVSELSKQLANQVSIALKQNRLFAVLGGDHTCAIGTWSGVFDALHHKGDIGLIWIDAHMDSHTPDTSETGNLHGMPLASLLGYGDKQLTQLLHTHPKLKPANICLIGIRSFEPGEQHLLESLNVKIYYMDEVKRRGFDIVLQEAVAYMKKHTIGYGISLDIDSIDPKQAPGVDVPEPDGIHVEDLLPAWKKIVADPHLITAEIVEFDPSRDKNHLTEQLVVALLKDYAEGKKLYALA